MALKLINLFNYPRHLFIFDPYPISKRAVSISILLSSALALLVILPVIYDLLVPQKLPDLHSYFKAGDWFSSNLEGFTQHIEKQDGDKVYSRLSLKPGAAGPPEHCHLHFHEKISVESGKVTVTLAGALKKLQAGETLLIPPKVFHRIYNETHQKAVIRSESEDAYLPVSFAYALSQLYGFFDEKSSNSRLPGILFQLAVFGNHFDSWMANPPIPVQRGMRRALRPYARLLGFAVYKESRRPRSPETFKSS